MTETLLLAELKFEIRRSPRRKTLGLTVDRAGELVVHAPETTDEEELRRWVHGKLLWVYRKLALKEELGGPTRQSEFVSGESLYYLGRNYRLKLVDEQQSPLRFDGHWFLLRREDTTEAHQHFRQWYQATGLQWLKRRVNFWQPKAGSVPAGIRVGELGFRWGSCGKNGVLHFNWRLLQLPVRLVDYIIVHELVHLQERSHTHEFRRALDRVLPDWRERRSELEAGWQSYVAFRNDKGSNRLV